MRAAYLGMRRRNVRGSCTHLRADEFRIRPANEPASADAFRDLRHICASLLLAQGVEPRVFMATATP